MKKRVLAAITLVLVLCFLLSGCVETNITLQIDDVGGSIGVNMLIAQDFLDQMSENDSANIDTDGMTYKGIVTRDGTQYAEYEASENFATYDEMIASLTGMSSMIDDSSAMFSSVVILREETDSEVRYTFRAVMPAQEDPFSEADTDGEVEWVGEVEGDDELEMELDGTFTLNSDFGGMESMLGATINDIFKFSFSIVLPANIVESSAGTVTDNKFVCALTDLTADNEIYAIGVLVKDTPVIEVTEETGNLEADNTVGAMSSNNGMDSSIGVANPTSIPGAATRSPLFWYMIAGGLSLVLLFCIVTLVLIIKERRIMR